VASPRTVVFPGPGNTHFDFGQKLSFASYDTKPSMMTVNPDSLMPTGCILLTCLYVSVCLSACLPFT
jgi:hypothetical protein